MKTGDLPAGRQEIHKSVLLHEVIEFLDPQKGDAFIDATIGFGGHTEKLLEKSTRVLGIDRDPEAIEYLKSEFRDYKNLVVVRGNFADIGKIARSHNFTSVKGILFDLGVSSCQLEKAERGFSFQKEGPLDMRMDPAITVRAYDIVNNFERRRLYEIFKTYGGEKFSRRIAGAVCSARKVKPIETTTELARIIEGAVPGGARERIHPATRTFQALRIVVNSELLNLEQALPQTADLLKVGGRLAVVSFHSLEDKIVKRFLKQEKRLLVLTKKPIGPTESEIRDNPRCRSAKLRVAKKV